MDLMSCRVVSRVEGGVLGLLLACLKVAALDHMVAGNRTGVELLRRPEANCTAATIYGATEREKGMGRSAGLPSMRA